MKHMHPVRRGTLSTISRFIGVTSALVIAALAASNLQAKEPLEELSFDVPEVAATYVTDISPYGEVAGFYVDFDFGIHAFLLTSDGNFAIFDAPQSGDETDFRPRPEVLRKPEALREPDHMLRRDNLIERRNNAIEHRDNLIEHRDNLIRRNNAIERRP